MVGHFDQHALNMTSHPTDCFRLSRQELYQFIEKSACVLEKLTLSGVKTEVYHFGFHLVLVVGI